ncbi:GNAT domain [Trinorchestia longiramus]|nr:GNAT domain [Trinorchestia longiramus]
MNTVTSSKCLHEPSTIFGHHASSCCSGPSLTCDIAPVHASNSFMSLMQDQKLSSRIMDTKKSSSLMNSSVMADVLPSASPALHRKKQSAGIPEITSDLRDKLNFRNTNGVLNGMKMGTTDVEVHHTGLSSSNCTSHGNKKISGSSSVSVRSKIAPAPLSNIANSTILFNSVNEGISSPPHDTPPPPPPPSFQDIPPLSPPHEPPPPPPCEEPGGYPYIKSVASRAIGADSPCSSKSSQDGGTGVCNGHTVSEATSNTSIAASSEFSISSERSTDSSYSGARARTRHTSNSSSQSTQPRSDLDLSLASDVVLKTPEISVSPLPNNDDLQVEYVNYENETQMAAIMALIQKDLSEPYSIYTYRYFIHNWPHLCFLALVNKEIIGAVVCKLDMHKKGTVRGYIAMLAVDQRYRKRKIGSNLVQLAMRAMAADDADEVVLETEITNQPALRLYQALGFVRDKRLFRYYLNGVDALRLKLWLR